jgi:hypothetical protein
MCDIVRGELFYASLSLQMASGAVRVATSLRKGGVDGFAHPRLHPAILHHTCPTAIVNPTGAPAGQAT